MMTVGHELDEARRLYFLYWILMSAMGAAFCVCLATSSFTVEFGGLSVVSVLIAPGLTAVGLRLVSREWKWWARIAFVLLAIAQLGFVSMVAAPLSYVAASAAFPLQDAYFAHVDRLLGFDWPAYYQFVVSRPWLLRYAVFFYAMIVIAGAAVSLTLGLTGRYVRLQQFVLATVLTLMVVITVSTLLPAIGTYYHLGLPAETDEFRASGYLVQLKDLPPVREGTLRVLDLANLGGIITFPSFHASAAILAMWALWAVPWMRPPALILNSGMLAATPLVGGHYVVDVLAGIAVAVLAIEAAKAISKRLGTAGMKESAIGLPVLWSCARPSFLSRRTAANDRVVIDVQQVL